jgi:D-glycero-D-manno-heptose 1,7-bisphosphate phosphatase
MEKNKILFLDRDGVILNNEKHYYIYRKSDMHYNPGVFEKLGHYAKMGYIFILISNQSGISKGIYSTVDTESIHQKIKTDFEIHGLMLADDFYCPHHPQNGHCFCRKPGSLLIEKALAKWNADLAQSFMVGDSEGDIEAATRAGIKAYKIEPNSNLMLYTAW